MQIKDIQTLGKVIRQTRHALNITQKDLALASGTGLRFIVDLEKGKPTCQIGKVMHVLKMLGISVELTPPLPSVQNENHE